MLIDAFAADWQNKLNTHASRLEVDTNLYLLLDGAFVPGLYREVAASLPEDHAVALLFEALPSCSEEAKAVSPFLVPYQPHSSRFALALDRCSGWPMVSAIETTETIGELSARLSAWCVIEVDQQRFNFRFPDTRRLQAIFNALTADQQAAMTGPATHWSLISRNGEWQELALPAIPAPITTQPGLNGQQFAAIMDDNRIDLMISILTRRTTLPKRLKSENYAIVFAALKAADLASLDENRHLDWCRVCLANPDRINGAGFFA